uniref:Uncharacterized protein n=1 Tax=Anguilla anguilla TaxID=7936 RepID=A0A0E9QSL3_ANGAN
MAEGGKKGMLVFKCVPLHSWKKALYRKVVPRHQTKQFNKSVAIGALFLAYPY